MCREAVEDEGLDQSIHRGGGEEENEDSCDWVKIDGYRRIKKSSDLEAIFAVPGGSTDE